MSDICPKCGLPKEICVCEDIAREQQRINIAVDTTLNTTNWSIGKNAF